MESFYSPEDQTAKDNNRYLGSQSSRSGPPIHLDHCRSQLIWQLGNPGGPERALLLQFVDPGFDSAYHFTGVFLGSLYRLAIPGVVRVVVPLTLYDFYR